MSVWTARSLYAMTSVESRFCKSDSLIHVWMSVTQACMSMTALKPDRFEQLSYVTLPPEMSHMWCWDFAA